MPHRFAKTADDLATWQFRTFVGELADARASSTRDTPTDADDCARQVQSHLLNLLEIQSVQSRRESTRFEIDNHADARYLKAVLADELLLHGDWPGQGVWDNYLLESTLFRSNVAGDKVFARIDAILADREASQRGLARLYLFALAMGFQGRYRGVDDGRRLRDYREDLYEFVYQRRAQAGGADQVLDPDAYANTLSHIVPRKNRTFSRWTQRFVISALLLLVSSEILWLWQSWPVRRAFSSDVTTRMVDE